eukprot:2145057-Amphidinium_carterae.1
MGLVLQQGDVPSGDEEDADSYAQSDLEHREAKKSEFVHDLEVLGRKLTHQPRSSRSLPGPWKYGSLPACRPE